MLIIRGPIALYTIMKDCCRRPCIEQHFSILHPRSIRRNNHGRAGKSGDQLQVHDSLVYRSWFVPVSAHSKCLLEVRLTSWGFQFLRKHTWCMTCLWVTVRKTGPRAIRSRCTPLSCNFMQRPTTAKIASSAIICISLANLYVAAMDPVCFRWWSALISPVLGPWGYWKQPIRTPRLHLLGRTVRRRCYPRINKGDTRVCWTHIRTHSGPVPKGHFYCAYDSNGQKTGEITLGLRDTSKQN